MRITTLLIVLLLAPIVLRGQDNTVFYNKGKMYVDETKDTSGTPVKSVDEANVKLFIDGTAHFANGSDVKTTDASHISLTGDLKSVVASEDGVNHIFTSFREANKPESGVLGFLYFVNDKKEDVSQSSAAAPGGTMYNLGLSKKQTISMLSTNKLNHFISLPAIRTDDDKGRYIAFDPKVAVAVGSPFSSGTGGAAGGYKTLISLEAKYSDTDFRRLDIAQVMGTITKNVSAEGMTNLADAKMSHAMLDLQLYDPTMANNASNAGKPGSNLVTYSAAGENEYVLTGFTPLGTSLYSDHMMFNVLTRPMPWSITGSVGPIPDVKYEMKPGYGYFIAIDAVPTTDGMYPEVEENHGVARANRAVGGYKFERDLFLSKRPNFAQFSKEGVSQSSNEALPFAEGNMFAGAITDFEVQLQKGLNFLGNPFTAALDLTDIIGVENTATLSDWGGISVSHDDPAADIRNKYWIVNDAKIRYFVKDGKGQFGYKVSYFDSSAGGVGGTVGKIGTDPAVSDLVDGWVGPMQMFVLQASKDVTIKLPGAKSGFQNTMTTRSTKSRIDELLLQSVVLGDNDEEIMEDRIALVLRKNASMDANDGADSPKAVTNASGSVQTEKSLKSTEVNNPLPYGGVLYTKASNGTPMLTNVIPTSTNQIALYFAPTDKEQRVRIRPSRLDSWSEIQSAWLYDKFEDRTIELTPDAEYVFTSKPLSADLAKENRFVLYFNDKPASGGDDDPNLIDDKISTYYNGGILYISGLNDSDMNSIVQIYDLQGRLMAKTKVDQAPSMNYSKPLSQGTYIVKILGKRNFTAKFLTLQN